VAEVRMRGMGRSFALQDVQHFVCESKARVGLGRHGEHRIRHGLTRVAGHADGGGGGIEPRHDDCDSGSGWLVI
jgi:hypothetical protein